MKTRTKPSLEAPDTAPAAVSAAVAREYPEEGNNAQENGISAGALAALPMIGFAASPREPPARASSHDSVRSPRRWAAMPPTRHRAAAALRAADAIDGVAANAAAEEDDDDAFERGGGDDTAGDELGVEDGAPRATKVRRVASTTEWSSRVLLEYAARRRYAAETAREAAKAERRRRRKEEREAARRRGGSAGREASASSAGAASTASDGSGSVAKRKASEEAGVPIYRFFAPRGSSPPA